MRSPLNAILGYGDLLKEDDVERPDSVIAKDIDRILDAGQYLTRLIDMILDLAKIESGKMKFNMQEHDIGGVVAKVVEQHRPEIEAMGNTLHFDVSPELRKGIIDANRVEQIADSIISNAAAHTANGEIEISLCPLGTEQDPGFSIVVRDTGRGIAEDALPFIFESFVTERDAADGRYGGTGLALSVTSKLCEAMNGSISAKSSVGIGSTFTVRLPIGPRVPTTGDTPSASVQLRSTQWPMPSPA